MATLLFAPGASKGTGLRSWLGGRWGMLFSHPDDFVNCDFELDRWISVARGTFDLNNVWPLALATSGQRLDAGWVSQLTDDTGPIVLSMANAPDYEQLHGYRLKADILQACLQSGKRRLVAIVDSNMKRRWTHTYDVPSSLPSPLELAQLAGVLRGRSFQPLTRAA
jgi:alkyl hydroperoxide reductase subunit AhpC